MTPHKEDVVTIEIARKAILCTSISNSKLFDSNEDRITVACLDAVEIISNNRVSFDKLLWNRISQLPLFKAYFSRFIRTRLKQNDFLASELLQIAFDDNPAIEQRLSRIQSIEGVEGLRREFGPPKTPSDSHQIENKARELLAEILVLDFLIQLKFTDIKKRSPRDRSQAHIDVLCRRDDQLYAIEVTRKKEIADWILLESPNLNELPFLEDCDDKANHRKICKLIIRALDKKDDQFSRALKDTSIEEPIKKVVAIKTSDYGFSECINDATTIAKKLLQIQDCWPFIDCIWLIPNINPNQSVWIFKNKLDHISF